ncbi:MAG TPA: hypothetical protein VFI95_17285 [Terriglobales bacterium]|nr:hypothetical protein [Terriglobales bacterium]
MTPTGQEAARLGKEESRDDRKAKPLRTSGLLLVCAVTAAAFLVGWSIGRERIRETLSPYRVTHVDSAAGTMALVRLNQRFIVRCDRRCSEFALGSSYRMQDHGGELQYQGSGMRLTLPIIERETTFETRPGGLG